MALSMSVTIIVVLYVVTGILSIALAPLYTINELILFENPENPLNILYLMFSIIAVFILVMLIVRLRLETLLKGLFYFSAFTVLLITISMIFPDSLIWLAASSLISASTLFLLNRFYKWYLADAVGVFLGASIAAWFGISLSPQVLVALLIFMAIYDYFAVRSGGMINLAKKTLEMNLPTMLMSPVKEVPKELKPGEGERRGAFLGLGDAAFPNMLTVSTYVNASKSTVYGMPLNLIAAMLILAGGIIGLFVVLYIVRRLKKPQPGLPYIGIGAVLGWIASTLLF
ncbi:MAG: presenilin family intramembrane aspartyl protease PSH [Thermoproteota archaeon]